MIGAWTGVLLLVGAIFSGRFLMEEITPLEECSGGLSEYLASEDACMIPRTDYWGGVDHHPARNELVCLVWEEAFGTDDGRLQCD